MCKKKKGIEFAKNEFKTDVANLFSKDTYRYRLSISHKNQ